MGSLCGGSKAGRNGIERIQRLAWLTRLQRPSPLEFPSTFLYTRALPATGSPDAGPVRELRDAGVTGIVTEGEPPFSVGRHGRDDAASPHKLRAQPKLSLGQVYRHPPSGAIPHAGGMLFGDRMVLSSLN